MKYPFNNRVGHFTPPKQWASMRMAGKAEQASGKRVIHFEKGDYSEPCFRIPEHVYETIIKALRDGDTRYDPGPGIMELREAIAEEMYRRGRPTSPEEVIITTGAKHALFMALLTFLEDGDEVLFPNPGYPPAEVWATFAGAKINHIPLTASTWQFNIAELARLISANTKLLIINSPQRPNGHLVENTEEIAEVSQRHKQLIIISDEIFSHLVYEEHQHKTIAALPGMDERAIVIDTFSKTYMMTGWRIGWAVAPKPIIDKLSIFLQDSITNVPVFIQKAARAALTGPQEWVESRVRSLRKKRDIMVAGLNMIPGIECEAPPATFYLFPNITGTSLSSQEFADELLSKASVSVVPGVAFGSGGEGFVRITYAVPDEDIAEGLRRMRSALGAD